MDLIVWSNRVNRDLGMEEPKALVGTYLPWVKVYVGLSSGGRCD